jgi:hypothetical protein
VFDEDASIGLVGVSADLVPACLSGTRSGTLLR